MVFTSCESRQDSCERHSGEIVKTGQPEFSETSHVFALQRVRDAPVDMADIAESRYARRSTKNYLYEYKRTASLNSALEPVDLYSAASFAAEEGFDLSEYPQFADWSLGIRHSLGSARLKTC